MDDELSELRRRAGSGAHEDRNTDVIGTAWNALTDTIDVVDVPLQGGESPNYTSQLTKPSESVDV